MSSGVCSHCGCTEIDIDQARGDAVCTGCGSVLEDQIIVSEVQFQESAGGSSSVIGQFVSSDGIKSHTLGSSFQQGFSRESRAVTLQNAKKKIQYVGAQLRLNQHCIDTAFNFFKMAVNKRLTRGRKTMHVVAACVYLVCRTEGTPHMLLDLSDILQVNVYSLGKTYLQLSRELCINVPAIDPCLYIPRFAHKLEFEDKTHEVSMTAMRLVQRMKRDWIHTGRRPSGLCGAALLVAARMHDFCRKTKDIIKVVRVCETTIRKRLTEFSNTASSELTIDEFQRIDLEEEADPPAFTAGKLKAKLAQMEDQNKLNDLTSEVSSLQEEIEKTLEKTQKKPRGPWAAYSKTLDQHMPTMQPTSVDGAQRMTSPRAEGWYHDRRMVGQGSLYHAPSLLVSSGHDGYRIQEEGQNEEISEQEVRVPPVLTHHGPVTDFAAVSLGILTPPPSQTHPTVLATPAQQTTLSSQATPTSQATPIAVDSLMRSVIDERDPEVTELEEKELTNVITSLEPVVVGPGPTAASIGIKECVEECMRDDNTQVTGDEDGELDLTGIDDEELDAWILGKEEVEVKTKLWMIANADYLQEQKEKEEREAKEREENMNKPEKKKRKNKKKQPIQANTAKEAIEQMLQQKKISNKINYDVLKDLNKTDSIPAVSAKPSKSPVPSRLKRQSLTADTSVMFTSLSRFRKPSISVDTLSEEPTSKKAKVESEAGPTELVVESGPVHYGAEEEGEEVEEEAEEEEDYLEEEPVSAAQLLGHTGYNEEDGDYYDVDDME